jgi:hypothetical protein
MRTRATHSLAMAISCLMLAACSSSGPLSPLSPARNLVGTWTDLTPVRLNVGTGNTCGVGPGILQWTFSLVITPGADDNHVNVAIKKSNGSVIFNDLACTGTSEVAGAVGVGYTLTGTISASNLILSGNYGPNIGVQAGTFNFTTDIVTGTYDYQANETGNVHEYTAPSALTFTRQP